jgi:hypothetical protein
MTVYLQKKAIPTVLRSNKMCWKEVLDILIHEPQCFLLAMNFGQDTTFLNCKVTIKIYLLWLLRSLNEKIYENY